MIFPQHFSVSFEELAYYGVGLQIFKDLTCLEDARNKVRSAVKTLKSSCLLLDGDDGSTTKMHDVVRKVALLIASEEDNKFLVESGKNLTKWQPRSESLKSCTGISLMYNTIYALPGYELNLPLLKIFLMQRNDRLTGISHEFARAMKEVKVVDFEFDNIASLPESMNQLTALRMLNLGGNYRLHDVSILGELTKLEILILNRTGITKIPKEIGKLVNLRLFQTADCPALCHIAPGVLSKLHWLEELTIGYYQVEEEQEEEEEDEKYNSLVEILNLSKLTCLKLYLPHISLFPSEMGDYLTRLKIFHTRIGKDGHHHVPGNKILILDSVDISSLKHVIKWLELCDGMGLASMAKLHEIMHMMYCECFGVKNIGIKDCTDLLCLVDSRFLDQKMLEGRLKGFCVWWTTL